MDLGIPVVCPACDGTGGEFSGVEHMGHREIVGCSTCAATGWTHADDCPAWNTTVACTCRKRVGIVVTYTARPGVPASAPEIGGVYEWTRFIVSVTAEHADLGTDRDRWDRVGAWFMLTEQYYDDYLPLGVAHALDGAKAEADARLRRVRHGEVGKWSQFALGLWGPSSWTREVEWEGGRKGWQLISITYFFDEEQNVDSVPPKEPPTCPRCGAYPGGCVRGCRGESQA